MIDFAVVVVVKHIKPPITFLITISKQKNVVYENSVALLHFTPKSTM